MKRAAILVSVAVLLAAASDSSAQRRGTISSPTATSDPGRTAAWMPIYRDPGLNTRIAPRGGDQGRVMSWMPAPRTPVASNPTANPANRTTNINIRPDPISLQNLPPVRLR